MIRYEHNIIHYSLLTLSLSLSLSFLIIQIFNVRLANLYIGGNLHLDALEENTQSMSKSIAPIWVPRCPGGLNTVSWGVSPLTFVQWNVEGGC